MPGYLIVGTVLATATALALAWRWQLGVLRAGVVILAQSMVTALVLSAVNPLAHFTTVTGTLAMWGITVLAAAGWLLIVFFRDPERGTPDRADVIVSPADGHVIYVKRVQPGEVPAATKRGHASLLRELRGTALCDGGALAVGISMSMADVHVNRAPIAGRVRLVERTRGTFGSLRKPEMAASNERVTTVVGTGDLQIAVVQIASRLVRRIVTFASEGDELRLGQRIGAIRFGSQVDLLLPAEHHITLAVQVGDRLVAGRTIVGVVVQSAPHSQHGPVRKNQDPYPERTRGDSLSPRLLPAGQPDEHGPEDHDRNQPAEPDVAGDAAEHVADDDHREDAEDDQACHGQVAHAVQVAGAASAEHRAAGRRDGHRDLPGQVGEQGGEVVSRPGLQRATGPLLELFLGEPPGLEVLAQFGDGLVAISGPDGDRGG
jgi:phosphatidylserine decarboxylase